MATKRKTTKRKTAKRVKRVTRKSKINLSLRNVSNATRSGLDKPLKRVVGLKGRLY